MVLKRNNLHLLRINNLSYVKANFVEEHAPKNTEK